MRFTMTADASTVGKFGVFRRSLQCRLQIDWLRFHETGALGSSTGAVPRISQPGLRTGGLYLNAPPEILEKPVQIVTAANRNLSF